MRPRRSLWLEKALSREAEEAPPLRGAEQADVCIVGGGYTGLWTAIRLKELDPALDVVLVEADICGGGASGRNGGFALSWWAKFGSLRAVYGAQDALALARASEDAVRAIGLFCDEHGIDARYRADGWLWAATSETQIGAWRAVVDELRALGVSPFEELEPADVARRAGSETHLAGVLERAAATVHPALLARGLRRVAVERGVRVFERSRMVALERERPPRVLTPEGVVRAERVVLALNAWSVQLRELRRSVVPIASDMIATEPVADRLAELGLGDGIAISDSRMLVNYYRRTDDGRLAFGKGGGAIAFAGRVGESFEGTSPRARDVERSLRALYPGLARVRVAASWTGPIDRTPKGLPVFGRLGGRPDLLFGVGYSGNGVGPSYLGGRILASLALGRDDEWSASPLVHALSGGFPPEPIRYVGGLVVRAAVARKEQAEDVGRRPGRLTVALAALAPAGLVPTRPPPSPRRPDPGKGQRRGATRGRGERPPRS